MPAFISVNQRIAFYAILQVNIITGTVMAIFLISPLEKDSSRLDEKIKKEFPESDRYQLRNKRDWLISSKDTSKVISEKLGVKKLENKEESIPALIVYVSSYWGLGNSDMWEWLDVKMEK